MSQYYLTNDQRDHAEPAFSHEPVVVEFGPPQNLRPAQLGLILDESADTKDVTATIIDLAVRGFLTISEVPGKRDWLFTRKECDVAGLLPYERALFDGLFANGRQQVKVSELKGTFQSTLRPTESEVYSDAMSRKLFRFRPDYMRGIAVLFAILGLIAGAGLAYAN